MFTVFLGSGAGRVVSAHTYSENIAVVSHLCVCDTVLSYGKCGDEKVEVKEEERFISQSCVVCM